MPRPTPAQEWKTRYKEAQSKIGELEKEILCLKELVLKTGLVQVKNLGINEVANELFDFNKKSEGAKEKKARLEKEISDKEKQKENLSSKNDEHIAKLKKELEEAIKEITRLETEVKKLEKKLCNEKKKNSKKKNKRKKMN